MNFFESLVRANLIYNRQLKSEFEDAQLQLEKYLDVRSFEYVAFLASKLGQFPFAIPIPEKDGPTRNWTMAHWAIISQSNKNYFTFTPNTKGDFMVIDVKKEILTS